MPSIISDTIIQGDSYSGFVATVLDSEYQDRIFSDVICVLNIIRPAQASFVPRQIIFTQDLIVDESVPGQVSVQFSMSPAETAALPTGNLTGELIFTFPNILVDSNPLISTLFLLDFNVESFK